MARGVVAAGHQATAAAGAEVLADGGNAVDAALACLCAAVVAEPVLASLGGGGFLVCRMNEGKHAGRILVYDFFVQTPAQRRSPDVDVQTVYADFGPAHQAFRVGLGTIATPGAIGGLAQAAEDLGRLPLRRLVEPACALARSGVRIDAIQAYIIGVVAALLNSRPDTAALFASPERSGALIGAGEVFRLPDYADTLEILAIEGADLFYRGEMGRQLADDCRAHGGHLVRADMERYRVERRSPVTVDRFDSRIHLNPPPAIGGLLIGYALALMPTDGLGAGAFGCSIHLRHLIATLAEADEIRLRLPDALDEAATTVLAPAFLAAGRQRLGASPVARRGTTHISVIDGKGSAAALSLSNGEGSSYVLPGTGIVLNNMLGEDDLCPDGPDAWPLDRRMSSMMAPCLIERGDGSLIALGSGGSSRIRAAILQVILNQLLLGETLAEAVDRPRLHLENGKLSFEPGFPEASVASLSSLAYDLEPWPAKNLFFGGVHAAMRDPRGGLTATGDGRRGGAVIHV
ncbi:MAG: gamma-glutamyltransferase [Rhodospirillales bacterium]